MFFRLALLFFICNLSSLVLHSQDYLGFANSEYAGVNGIDVNPASIVNSPRKWDITLVGMNFAFGNNFAGFQKRALEPTGSGASKTYPAFNDTAFTKNYLTLRGGSKPISVYTAVNLALPSFMFIRSKHKDAFAFTCRTRVYVNVDGIDRELANTYLSNGIDSSYFDQGLSLKKISAQAMAWAEYGITYGKTIMETGNERLNVGGRLKLLQGLAAGYGYLKNADYELNHEDTTLTYNGNASFGYSSNVDNAKPSFGFGGGPSLGLDVGATYEFHPLTNVRSRMRSQSNTTPLQHEYRYKLGFSFQDIGWIGFKKSSNSRDYSANANIDIVESFKDGVDPFAELDKSFTVNESKGKFRMNLPTVMNLTGDYYAGKNVYVNSTLHYAFQFKNNKDKVHEVTTISITPRWDWKWLGLYAPVSYNKYSHMRLGLSARIGMLIIGMADILPLVSKRDIYGADFHFMLKVPHLSFGKSDKNPNTRTRYDVERSKSPKRKEYNTNMPERDQRKSPKHIFPKVRIFKKKRNVNVPDQEQHIIYFKM